MEKTIRPNENAKVPKRETYMGDKEQWDEVTKRKWKCFPLSWFQVPKELTEEEIQRE